LKQIFVIAPLYLFPPAAANQQDIVGRIRLFQELGYQVTVCTFPLPHQQFDIAADKKKYELNIELLERKGDSSFSEYRLPKLWYKSSQLINQESFNKLSGFVQRDKPDVLWFEYSSLSPLAHAVAKKYKGQIIFRYHNHELRHFLEKLYLSLKDNLWSSLPAIIWAVPNVTGISRCDRLMFSVAKKVACISTRDMSYLRQYNNIIFLPYFPPNEVIDHKNNPAKDVIDVFYFGSELTNNVNKSGLDFIARKVIPCLKERNIDFITFHILGKNPPEEYKSGDIPHLKLHGFVDDLDRFLEDMDVGIIPVFYGMGFKVKTYESLRRGFPVVASKRGLSNFNGIDGDDYFSVQIPEEFVEKLVLLRDASLREKLGNNALKLIARDFSKEEVMRVLENILEV